jgi:outer membrane protein OmpA-like peptidoglycan-associated protein
MKKILFILTTIAFIQPTFAQTEDKKWGIGGGFGAYGTLENGQIGVMPELYLSRYLSSRFDLMLKGDMGVFRTNLNNNLDLANPFLNLRFKLANETKKLRPYLFAGPGYLADNGTSALNFDLGLGAKYYTRPAFALYLEAGYLRGIESTSKGVTGRENIWKVTAGGEIDFGKAKDADMDGVSDNKDKCPNTPTGVAVDKNGCPIDTDGDGVADFMDDCPTVAGLTSLKGCPDKDKDGIADKDDACPDVAGLVSMKGCPDTDSDGVADKDDKCPDTKKGDKVDASGCPLVVDTDGDGVIDSEDKCPTVAGSKENKGCPVIDEAAKDAVSPEMTIEPVYFDYGNSTVKQIEKAKIEKLVKLLKSNSNYNVDLTGNADSKGKEEYNMKLSEKRINSVVKAITSSGVKAARISKQKPLGETQPAATNDTEEGRALNRRVEFEIVKSK